ncbi:MAG: AAA family ATPase, partial [Thermomicrobium sp.]|nr:AAA family ATPase [Thermomicrobium sp.]
VAREPGVIGVAADLVEAPPALIPIVESLLGRVLVADDLATVRRLLPQLPPGWVIVTREGELARPTGSVTGGATRGRERGFLSLVRQRRAFAARQERLAASLEEARRQFLAARDAVERARRSLESVRDQLRTQETKLVQLDHEWVQLVRSIQRLDDALAREAESIAAVRAALARDDEQARALHEQEDALHAALDDLEHQRAQVADAIARLDTPDPEREQLLEQIATLRERERAGARERSQLAQRLGELRQRLAALHARWDELRAEHTQFLAEAERSDAEAKRLALEAAELETEERARTVEIERLAEQAKALRTESARAEQRLRQLAQESAAARAALERAERALHSLLEQAAWELAEGSLDAELVERLEQASRAQQDPPERWERRVAELRRRWQELSRFGEAAIAQYESERERYESLRAQLEDVRGTTQALRKLLADLDREVERGLVRSLRALDRAFADTFAELFGGGRARLVARNGAGSIEGVDLVVQPAGKRVRSVQQLSGGERALTAIALRFALLELDPLPFCVLDEVDAALDEANVARFRGVLERLAERTQFLVITHNRVTIEAAGTLYGVTMGEDGVSRVVSLRLADYACG